MQRHGDGGAAGDSSWIAARQASLQEQTLDSNRLSEAQPLSNAAFSHNARRATTSIPSAGTAFTSSSGSRTPISASLPAQQAMMAVEVDSLPFDMMRSHLSLQPVGRPMDSQDAWMQQQQQQQLQLQQQQLANWQRHQQEQQEREQWQEQNMQLLASNAQQQAIFSSAPPMHADLQHASHLVENALQTHMMSGRGDGKAFTVPSQPAIQMQGHVQQYSTPPLRSAPYPVSRPPPTDFSASSSSVARTRDWPWAEGPSSYPSGSSQDSFFRAPSSMTSANSPRVLHFGLDGSSGSGSNTAVGQHHTFASLTGRSPLVPQRILPNDMSPSANRMRSMSAASAPMGRTSSATAMFASPYGAANFGPGSVARVIGSTSLANRGRSQSTGESPAMFDLSSSPFFRRSGSSGMGTTRRAKFKRSRTGCVMCRRRKVKCDESGPPCSQCRIGSRECVYEANPPPRRRTSKAKQDEAAATAGASEVAIEDEEEDEAEADGAVDASNSGHSRSGSLDSPASLAFDTSGMPETVFPEASPHVGTQELPWAPSAMLPTSPDLRVNVKLEPVSGHGEQQQPQQQQQQQQQQQHPIVMPSSPWMHPVASGIPGDFYPEASSFDTQHLLTSMSIGEDVFPDHFANASGPLFDQQRDGTYYRQ